MEKWFVHTKKADFDEIGRQFRISPVTARILRNRDVTGDEAINRYLHGTLADLHPPKLLKDMDKAILILQNKIIEKKSIRIIGDYDIDGVCSTYILYCALKRCGACVDFEIPDRIKDGYGINQSIIQAAYEAGVDTLLTCDNGIAAIEQITYAKELGLTVIVTDHHEVPYTDIDGQRVFHKVSADAVVNPKQLDCTYPFKGICGAVVAYKLAQALYEALDLPWEEVDKLIEFAAIATVGDVMQLQDENRIIVKKGLDMLHNTANYGLRSLIENNNLNPETLSAYHIGFVIGPCLNAGGRLQTAKLALALLLSTNFEEAETLAGELKELNDKRKEMTLKGLEEAIVQIEQKGMHKDKVLVIYLPSCHESLAGIIAGRVRERYQKPAFVLTKTEDGVKGSGRSIEAYHMYEALVEVEELLTKFGGHPMAAGLSLPEEHVDEFRVRLNTKSTLNEQDFIKKIWIDVPMPLEYITETLIQELECLEPFGQGNQKPLFAQKNIKLTSMRVMGKNRNVVRLSLMTEKGLPMDGILFIDGDEFTKEVGTGKSLDITYYPSINDYNGNRTLQVVIQNYTIKA